MRPMSSDSVLIVPDMTIEIEVSFGARRSGWPVEVPIVVHDPDGIFVEGHAPAAFGEQEGHLGHGAPAQPGKSKPRRGLAHQAPACAVQVAALLSFEVGLVGTR